jgi:hypothetical protein
MQTDPLTPTDPNQLPSLELQQLIYLRHLFAFIADDWEAPEMDVYDTLDDDATDSVVDDRP